ncbi:unnamed protein product [Didymodactylos carnosus]|uniref:Uncharacterized protein n=1 Tax=Didymodactylos carnosus TaxID=1234261 RepID=A0A814S9R6_9BILA|nr:unnamed protein product [Didymodactylos carnosus]CAF1250722.1 unnamed protein product [Didymodactylos carnosus]CAF3908822.1 unnamed protein product [Didymodactylos carnosus]CAF4058142.1 unnamed protein product [Didymodactylos carnosus]
MYTSNRSLIHAIEQCQSNKLAYLIEHGHDIHVRNSLGENILVTTLKYSSKQQETNNNRRLKLFILLLSYNVNPHLFDKKGKNVFNWACTLNCTQEALYLLKSYAGEIDILRKDKTGLCSLHYTCEHGNFELVKEIVQYLLKYRVRFDTKDDYGNTPDVLAEKLGFNEIADYLKEKSKLTAHSSLDFIDEQLPLTSSLSSIYVSAIDGRISCRSKLSLKTKGTSSDDNDVFIDPKSEINSANAFETGTVNTRQPQLMIDWYEQLQERIQKAKANNDWSSVISLRLLLSRISNEVELRKQIGMSALALTNHSSDDKGEIVLKKELNKTSNTLTLPPIKTAAISLNKPASIDMKIFPLISTGKTSEESIKQLLSSIEIQISPSYRKAFIPTYKRPSIEPPPPLLKTRRRESNVNLLDIHHLHHPSRISLPALRSSKRNSIASGRISIDHTMHQRNSIVIHS